MIEMSGMSDMRVDHDSETLRAFCRRCEHGWLTTYEVLSWDSGGMAMREYRVNGQPVPSPWRRAQCPFCGGLRVDVTDPGDPAAPAPRPPLTRPGRPAESAQARRRSRRMLTPKLRYFP
jgi:hypothetical protein